MPQFDGRPYTDNPVEPLEVDQLAADQLDIQIPNVPWPSHMVQPVVSLSSAPNAVNVYSSAPSHDANSQSRSLHYAENVTALYGNQGERFNTFEWNGESHGPGYIQEDQDSDDEDNGEDDENEDDDDNDNDNDSDDNNDDDDEGDDGNDDSGLPRSTAYGIPGFATYSSATFGQSQDLETSDSSYSGQQDESEDDVDMTGVSRDQAVTHPLQASSADQHRGKVRGRGRGRRGGLRQQLRRIDEGLGLLTKTEQVQAAGRGRGRGRVRGRGSRKGPVERMPRRTRRRRNDSRADNVQTLETKQLHEEASRAYIEGDFDRAEDCISRAIERSPEMFTLHSLLAEILEAKGEKGRAPFVLFAGAHIRLREPKAWLEAADSIESFLDRQEPEDLEMQVPFQDSSVTLSTLCTKYLMYCYSNAAVLDKKNYDVRQRRALLYRKLETPKLAVRDYQWLIERGQKEILRDPETLKFVSITYLDLHSPHRAIPFFEAMVDSIHEDDNVTESLEWEHITILADVCLSSNNSVKGLKMIKKLSRTLLGRSTEDYWDDQIQDDREFDLWDEPRRTAVPHFRSSGNDEAYGAGIPMDLRIKLGLLRLLQNELTEAMLHFNWIRYDDDRPTVLDFAAFYAEIALALARAEYFEEAISFFEPLRTVSYEMDANCLDTLAHCYEEIKQFDDAEALYLASSQLDGNEIAAIEKLALMFSKADLPARAEPYLQRLNDQRRQKLRSLDMSFSLIPSQTKRSDNPESDIDEVSDNELYVTEHLNVPGVPQQPSVFRLPRASAEHSARRGRLPKLNGVNSTSLQQLRELKDDEVQLAFTDLMELGKRPDSGDEWMDMASKLLQVFRMQKVFYPYDKHQRFWGYTSSARALSTKTKTDQESWEKSLREGRHDNTTSQIIAEIEKIPTEFCRIHFSAWLDLFLEYALRCAKAGNAATAFETCQAAIDANIYYHSRPAVERIYCVWGACAVICDDEQGIETVSRHFMKDQQFLGDAYRFHMALNMVKRPPNHGFHSSRNQKFVLRHLKAMDFALLQEEDRVRLAENLSMRAQFTRMHPETNEPILPSEVSAELLMVYASMMYAGSSHQEALTYMTRIYALRPQEPLLNLLMGLSHIGRAFKRQTANRQYQIMQGLSFVRGYYDLRSQSKDSIERQEAEFNMGRTFHLLGLTHLSIPHYEKCLGIGRQIGREAEENFAIEAALALQTIWAGSGQSQKAEAITEEWLVL